MSTAILTRRDAPAGPPPSPPTGDPRWARPAALAMLVATAVLYLWDLAASGWANSYYAAAVQAGTRSWTAMFFGSLDAGNAITVDKPPASLWVMDVSARIFGFNAWSLLVPQALEGVAAVGLLYLAVRRWHGAVAGLLAGTALAVTPVAALMFRFDNPDALLTLLLVASAYALVRGIEAAATRAGTRWFVLAGVVIGFAFLTKMLQAFLVVPGFALAVLVAAPVLLRRRLFQLVAAGVGIIGGAGWWVLATVVWPASARPYIGGSTDNSVLQLVLGYNGLARITGGSGSPGGGSGTAGSSFGGATGLGRLFGSDMAVDVAWLLPAALLSLVVLLVARGRAPRTDRTRASALLWGGWLVVTGLVLSYMQGTVHPYYTVALAPAVAALVAVAGRELWQRRTTRSGRAGLAGLVVAAGGTGFVLLARDADWYPMLRWSVIGVTALVALGLLAVGGASRRTTAALVLAGSLAGLAGPAAYTIATAASPHNGSIPTAGPASAAGSGRAGGFGSGGPGGAGRTGTFTPPSGAAPPSSGTSSSAAAASGERPSGSPGPGGQPGGGDTASSALSSLLATTSTRWSGSDPAPTLAQFEQEVASGQVRYFVVSGGGGGQGGDNAITSWVTSHCTATTVGTATVYDLSTATSAG